MGSAKHQDRQGASAAIARTTLENRISFTFSEADLPITVGRDSGCTVHLPYAHVSRRHCEITRSEGQLTIRDTSTNGTEIEGMLIRGGEVPVRGTMTLSFAGQTSFKLTAFAVEAPASPPQEGRGRRLDERRNGDRRRKVIEVNFDRRRSARRREDRPADKNVRTDITTSGLRETLSLDEPLITDPD